jgi:F-type H+-transporting ATPase subunit epsilon
MPDHNLQIDVVTPEGVVYSGAAKSCTAPGSDGQFSILYDHTALLAHLDIGELKFELEENDRHMATSGGLLEVKDNFISIIVETAEWAGDIDLERAQSAEKRARERLRSKEGVDAIRAQLALARAINRVKVASYIKML